jgi:hypothetical protein
MRQRIELQLEAHILDQLCQTQGCQFNCLLFCNPGRLTSVFNLSEALDVLCNSFPLLLPDLCQVSDPSLSSLRVVLDMKQTAPLAASMYGLSLGPVKCTIQKPAL